MRKVTPKILAVLALLAGGGILISYAGSGAQAQSLPSYKYDPTWPKPLPNKWKMGGVTGLAVDKNDDVWVLNRPNDLTDIEVEAELTPPPADCCVHPPSMIHIDKAGNVIFADMNDRHGHKLLSIRDMNTFDSSLQKKRLMTLAHLFLIHRYKTSLVHYLSPTEDNQHQALKMKRLGIFGSVNTEGDLIIGATVNATRINDLLNQDKAALRRLISKQDQPVAVGV